MCFCLCDLGMLVGFHGVDFFVIAYNKQGAVVVMGQGCVLRDGAGDCYCITSCDGLLELWR